MTLARQHAVRPLSGRAMRFYVDAGTRWAWQLEDALAEVYDVQIRAMYDQAAKLLARRSPLTAASPPAGWTLPDPDELGLSLREQMDARHARRQAGDDASEAIRVEAMRRVTEAGLEAMFVSLSVRNALVEGVLREQLGGKIVGIRETTRRDIMGSLEESWKAGDSIPRAAAALRALAPEIAASRSRTIARTEMLAAVNGGAHALASISNEAGARDGQPPLLKIWLTAEDERVRDSHVDAGDAYGAGSGIPIDEPFEVGDSRLQFPGDPDGSAGEVINCRCAISYEEESDPAPASTTDEVADSIDATTASLEGTMETYHGFKLAAVDGRTAFGGVPVYEFADLPSIVPEDAIPISGEPDAREWTSVIALTGVPTSDGRMLGADISWRELPLTLMALLTTDEGHKGAFVAGRIDSIETMPVSAAISKGLLSEPEVAFPPDALAIVGRGVFDDSWAGDEVMRLVASETLRGVSIDLAPEAVEVVEMPLADGETAPGYLEIVTRGDIMGATVCPFPAFKEATIRVDSLADEASESDEPEPVVASMRARRPLVVIVAAGIVVNAPRALSSMDYSDSSMIAVHPTSEQCSALALEGGQPAGDLHVTLAYLPHPESVDFAKLNDVVAGVAAQHDAVEGKVGGAGYFKSDAEAPAEDAGEKEEEPVVAADAPPEVPEAETPAEGETPDADAGAPPAEVHAHVALVDAPGLSRMRAALCSALDDAGIDYAQNHDFTPHVTLGYEAAPGVPAVAHAGKPLSFSHITVHEGRNQTAHALRGTETLTASAAGLAPLRPPAEWFENPGLSEPTPLTINDDGHIYGHLATWGTCHVGIRDACVQPPESATDYALFHLGHVETEEGELVPVGTFTMDTGHAGLSLGLRAAQSHYDNTGTAVADVRCGEDDVGIWFSGAIRPDLDERKVRALRAAQISGDWRPHDGSREFCAGLAVNVPGYPVVRPRSAIAASGQLLGLVAAGVDLAPAEPTRSRVLALAERARPGYLDERRDALSARLK